MRNSLFFFMGFLLFLNGCTYFDVRDESGLGETSSSETTNIVSDEDNSLYYYYLGEKIYLNERTDLVFLLFCDNESRAQYLSGITSVSSLQVWDPDKSGEIASENYYNALVLQAANGTIPIEQLEEFRSREDIKWVSYLTSNQERLSAITDEFSVRLKHLSDYSDLKKLTEQYNCEVYHLDGFDADEYCVRVPKTSKLGTIQLANYFHETGKFQYTSPFFFRFKLFCSSDPLFSYQWGLKNTGQIGGVSGIDINAEAAWNITEGSSDVVVAILDVGVELTHPDLAANLVTGYDAVSCTTGGAPYTSTQSHGTWTAGIVGAIKDNNIGISGVAPGCKIMPINAAGWADAVADPALIRGFNWARNNGVDVINCSWSGGDENNSLTAAIDSAASLGRGGKGCVIVFSSGNEGSSNLNYPAYRYNVISVGAINPYGYRRTSSNYGSGLTVVAPGENIETSTTQGSYEPVSGTSFAAPHVSGISALILSEYPELSQEDVREAIRRGAVTLSGYTFSSIGSYPSWYYWNEQVGSGLASATGALNIADEIHDFYVLEHTPGLDFTIINSSSYDLDDVSLDIQGTISGQTEWLISSDIGGGVPSGEQVGYPYYRGYSLTATPGTPITNISVNLFASCEDCLGNLEIGVAFDTPTPNSFQQFSFGQGASFQTTLPNITVPNESRRRVYVRIFDYF